MYYRVLLLYCKELLQSYSVLLQHYSSTTLYYSSTTPVLLCTSPVLLLCYKVLLQYYSVLQSTTPAVLLCTTKNYSSSATLYHKVLLQQYYSVLQKNYSSSATLYYKVLLQYCSVLQISTPALLCTTKYYSSTTPVLLCSTQVLLCTLKYYSNSVLQSTTRYNKTQLQYYSVLQMALMILDTYRRWTKYPNPGQLRPPTPKFQSFELLPRVGMGGQNKSNPPASNVMCACLNIEIWGAGWHVILLLRV